MIIKPMIKSILWYEIMSLILWKFTEYMHKVVMCCSSNPSIIANVNQLNSLWMCVDRAFKN